MRVGALVVLLVLAACKAQPPPPARTGSAGPTGSPTTTGSPAPTGSPTTTWVGGYLSRASDSPLPVENHDRVFLPVTLAETAPLLPTPPGARTLEPPHALGPRIEASFCVDADPETAAAHTRDTLAAAGWPDATATPLTGVPGRYLLAAHEANLVLAGFLDRNQPGCDAVFVTYGVHAPGPDVDRPPATADQPRIIGRP